MKTLYYRILIKPTLRTDIKYLEFIRITNVPINIYMEQAFADRETLSKFTVLECKKLTEIEAINLMTKLIANQELTLN